MNRRDTLLLDLLWAIVHQCTDPLQHRDLIDLFRKLEKELQSRDDEHESINER